VGALTGAASPDAFVSTTTATAQGGALSVFAAASLAEAFGALGQQFDAANGTQTMFNFAGSQQLAQQIVQGAPADVFASANTTQMRMVLDSGDVISGTQQTFVRNRLVVIHPQDNPAGLQTLDDLAKPGVKLVLADKAVPVGQYALDFLAKASEDPQRTAAYSETVLANVVSYEENVRAVLTKVALGEADAGIVYMSDVAQSAANDVGRIAIPDELNTIAAYPIAPIAGAPNAVLAEQFITYVLSPEGQQILSSYGFIPVASP
jgi:molybdate transport system substrate-binding protein